MNPLLFPMGQYKAPVPTDRLYTPHHLWVRKTDTAYQFGLTAYVVRLLGDVYFLEWTIDSGCVVAAQQPIGEMESQKAESQLFAPIAGRIERLNEELLYDPAIINQDTYGTGWLLEIAADSEEFLDPQQYIAHLHATWHETEKLIRHGTCKLKL